jgi:hypothetical protein
VVVVEYGADGRAIERERLQLPPRAADPRMDARRASLRRSTVPA